MKANTANNNDGLSMITYVGDEAVLFAFDLDKSKLDKFAGFSIHCVAPKSDLFTTNEYFLKNRLNFSKHTPGSELVGSDKAPFQTFHWVHFPSVGPGEYQYTAYASYFKDNGNVELGPKISTTVNLNYRAGFSNFEAGFTRGYISSQAFGDMFPGVKDIRPPGDKNSVDFDTSHFKKLYNWTGAHARKMVIDFLEESVADDSIFLDVFAYDLDEPDIIRYIGKKGDKVRLFQDNYIKTKKDEKTGKVTETGHGIDNSRETRAVAELRKKGVNVKGGCFRRFAHNKVIIQKKNNEPIKVLTGSANFSLRGLYVQANSVLIFDNADVANLYEQAFEVAFSNAAAFTDVDKRRKPWKPFVSSPISSKWYDIMDTNSLPRLSVSFAPHKTSSISLEKVSEAIDSASSSVLFAIMEMKGKGPVMESLDDLAEKMIDKKTDIVSLGTIQNDKELKLFKPGHKDHMAVASFSYLKKSVPEPFRAEWSGGLGQVIHHKFVACDFNGKNPVVFCGSSNLAGGGEEENADNLLAIYDRKVATLYAIEAIRLFDHYHFRTLQAQGNNKKMTLKSDKSWTDDYYDSKNIKYHERILLSSPLSQ